MKRTILIITCLIVTVLGAALYFVSPFPEQNQTTDIIQSTPEEMPVQVALEIPKNYLDTEENNSEAIDSTPLAKEGKRGSVALGFTSIPEKTSSEKLHVKGKIPNWLSGDLIRTGPALFEHKGGRASAWSEGCGMIYKFHIDNSGVSYDNHLVQTDYLNQVTARGQFGVKKEKKGGLFGKLGSLFGDTPKYDNANVNICCIGGEYCAMTETPLHTTFDPEQLKSNGAFSFDDKIDAHYACAHPHTDSTGDLYNYMIQFGNTSTYVVYKIPAGTKKRVPLTKINVGYPCYMHSFGMTQNYLLLLEQPYRVNPLDLLFGDKSFIETYQWKPKQGTKITLIDKKTGAIVASYTTDAFFALHQINAYEKNNDVIIDVAAYQDASILSSFDVEKWQSPHHPTLPKAYATRITIKPASKSIEQHQISSKALEMPRINYEQFNGNPYNFVYGTHMPSGAKLGTHIIKLNVNTGKSLTWHENDCYPGEPVFVAAPNAKDEDDGILLSVVLDTTTSRSFLLMLDAKNLKEVARAELAHHIPFDSHGHFFRTN